MKHILKPVFALAAFAILASASVQAETQEKMIIALKTGDFELIETDIGELAIGEAQTIETESGKVIDILRTVDGAEIYVDGELLEMNFNNENPHQAHMLKKHVEVTCEVDEEGTSGATRCSDEMVWISDGEEIEFEAIHEMHKSGKDHQVIVIRTEIVSEN
jgi:hypothetical protein